LKYQIAKVALAAALMTGATLPSLAEGVDFSGKTIQLYIGFGPGGSYDLYARALAQHMGKHILGNPAIVPMNMEGAGSMLLTNWLYNVAPKDGTAIATISRAVPFFPLIGEDRSAAQFDPTKFTWLGSANDEVSTCVAWADSGIETYEDLLTEGMILGGDGPTADGEQFARLMNGVLDTKIRVITGYGGSGAMNLAMENGEIQGRCGWSWSSIVASQSQWLADGKINVLMQMGREPHPDLKDVPTLADKIERKEDKLLADIVLARQPLGRPFIAPPDLPQDVADTLQKAFDATMSDPEFLEEATRIGLEVNPLSGAEVAQIVSDVFDNASEDTVDRLRKMLQP
jgi:tripartite-type tricarboxylate transporter receptor subunit TctC